MSHSRSKSNLRNTRDVRYIAKPSLSFRPNISHGLSLANSLQQISDRRLFHPDGIFRSAVNFKNAPHSLSVSNPFSRRLSPAVKFSNPHKVLVCVRRKIRKQILFAKGGAGSRRMRKPVYNYYSSVRC